MASGKIPFEQYPYFQSISSSANLNDYKTPGLYRWTYTPTNAPTYGLGSAWANAQMEVRADGGNGQVTQIVTYNPGSDSLYPNVKRIWTGSAWGNWFPIIDNSHGYDSAVVLNSANDLNNVVQNGIYRWPDSSVPSNAPSSTNCVMFVFGDSSAIVGQIVMPMLGSYGLYIRGKYGSWATQWYHLTP